MAATTREPEARLTIIHLDGTRETVYTDGDTAEAAAVTCWWQGRRVADVLAYYRSGSLGWVYIPA